MTTTMPAKSGNTTSHQQRLREAYLELSQRFPDYFVTLVTNRNTLVGKRLSYMSLDEFHRAVRDFHKRIDTALLGTRASKRPQNQRTNGLMFVEHAGRNIHGHAFVRFADQDNRTLEDLKEICGQAWAAICPGGNVLIQAQYGGGPGFYPSKELERRDYDFDQTILFSTFVSKD
ncbi:hypothetical protein DEVEQU_01021 [Devosia equisanguinis]|uniref:Inovirus Gp2 family protein n=1 Tax=Devosia equisanguinis TaxID=2490941 RepID=A0A3S4CAN3_9HYPH|nr:hypothetical protein [Devosia equisanguinis]VDS03892.1 hypothetical protein DEVEQU_01021 [Devosia equisanguinis]